MYEGQTAGEGPGPPGGDAKRLEPDVVTHNAASSACEKTKQPERTLDLLAEMQSKDLEPDAVACGAAISAS